MEIFTLTLTLSLKGEGIAELRKSYRVLDAYTTDGKFAFQFDESEELAEWWEDYGLTDDVDLNELGGPTDGALVVPKPRPRKGVGADASPHQGNSRSYRLHNRQENKTHCPEACNTGVHRNQVQDRERRQPVDDRRQLTAPAAAPLH